LSLFSKYPNKRIKKRFSANYEKIGNISDPKLRKDIERYDKERTASLIKLSDRKTPYKVMRRVVRYTRENLLREIEKQAEYFLNTKDFSHLESKGKFRIPGEKKVLMYYFDTDELPYEQFVPGHVELVPYMELGFPPNFKEIMKLRIDPKIPKMKVESRSFNTKKEKPKITDYFTHDPNFTTMTFKRHGKNREAVKIKIKDGMKCRLYEKLFDAYMNNDEPWMSASVLLQGLNTGYKKPSEVFRDFNHKGTIIVDKRRNLYRLNLPAKEEIGL